MQKLLIASKALLVFIFLVTSSFVILNDDNKKVLSPSVEASQLGGCLMAFPNPADTQITFKINDNIATTGQSRIIVRPIGTKAQVNEILIDRYRVVDVSNYPDGVYTATPVIQGQMCRSVRFTIMHK